MNCVIKGQFYNGIIGKWPFYEVCETLAQENLENYGK